MAGSGATKRRHALSIRCARLRADGLSLSEISEITGVPRDRVRSRIVLGERLMSLEEAAT